MNLHHDMLIVIDQNNHDHWFWYFMAKPHSDCEYQRFNNMRHKLVSSKWIQFVNSRFSFALFDTVVTRLRFEFGFAFQLINNWLWNRPLDVNGTYAICCALGEGTRRHNEIRDVVFHVTKMTATSIKREVLGLLDTAPRLRSVDILIFTVILCFRHWRGRGPQY